MEEGSDDLGLSERVPLSQWTTLAVGGPARWWATVESVRGLERARRWARNRRLEVFFLGEGSNVLFPDRGFPGLVVQNRIRSFDCDGLEVDVGSGENLGALIHRLNRLRLSGMERMYGIPGTVAGAVVGNAGAYGQEIRDVVQSATVWSEEGIREIDAAEIGFEYRHSLFKERRGLFLVTVRLRLKTGDAGQQEVSEAILKKREVKYPPGLRSPGSFFKNVPVATLSAEALKRIPADFIHFGKIPAGKLLEAVGACGARRGGAMVASYHGNLILNGGGATSRDILELASEYSGRVWERYRLRLEPEIHIVSLPQEEEREGEDPRSWRSHPFR